MSDTRRACLYICNTCTGSEAEGARSAAEFDAAGEPRPGALLYEQVSALLAESSSSDDAIALDIQGVVCLANCEQGCSVAIAEPGKWGYLLGGLAPEFAADLVSYGKAYTHSASGTVMRSKRPASLHSAIIARFPVPNVDGGDEAFLKRTVSTKVTASS